MTEAPLFNLLLPDGGKLAYRQWGPDEARPVVLLHSLAMTGSFWAPVADRLAVSGFRVIAPDCRGHGASSINPAMTVETAADDVAALLDHLGIGAAAIAGASMGGSVALAFAILYPDRTTALGLVDTTGWYGEVASKNWAERAEKARVEGLASLVGFQTSRWFTDAFREAAPKTVDEAVATFLANDIDGYAAACNMLGACDLRSELGSIQSTTVVIVGEEDYATPLAMSEAMAEAIPDARLRVLAGLRHLTPLEAPDQVADILTETFAGAAS